MQHLNLHFDEDYSRVLHIGEVALLYYKEQRTAPNEHDYAEWLSLLPAHISKHYKAVGFNDGRHTLDFLRHFMVVRDREKKAFMQRNLNQQDFTLWLERRNHPSSIEE